MKPSLFLHIGHGKTGSTTIQRALQGNAEDLRTRGLLLADGKLQFPVSGPVDLHPLLPFNRLLRELPLEAARTELRAILDDLKTLIQTQGFRGAVISSENLYTESGANLFAGVKEEFDLHVIYYIRRQDEWVESGWKQWGLKKGLSLVDYARAQIETGNPDYLTRARAWRDIASTLRVVPLNAVSDIVRTFWDALGLTDFNPPPTPPQNQTFDWSILQVLSKNPFLFSSVQDNRLFNLLERLLPDEAPRDGHALLPQDCAEEIMAAHWESNQALQREFFPEFLPLCDYPPRRAFAVPGDQPDEAATLYRFMGIQLLMLRTLEGRLHEPKGLPDGKPDQSDRRLVKLESRVDKLVAENKELRRKITEIEAKMARSVSRRLRRWISKASSRDSS